MCVYVYNRCVFVCLCVCVCVCVCVLRQGDAAHVPALQAGPRRPQVRARPRDSDQ